MTQLQTLSAKLFDLIDKTQSRPVCLLDTSRSGGSTAYSLRRVEEYLAQGRSILYLTGNGNGSLNGTLFYRDIQVPWSCSGIHQLVGTRLPKFHAILVNNLVGWSLPEEAHSLYTPVGEGRPRWIPAIASIIVQLADIWKARLEFVLHDYFAVCPNFTLLNDEQQEHYCGVPSMLECRQCLQQPFMCRAFGSSFSIQAWRDAWDTLLARADSITCPSAASRDVLLRAFSAENKRIRVIPHKPLAPAALPLSLPGKKIPMHVGVVGRLTLPKGAGMVRKLALLLREQKPVIPITLVGGLAVPGMDLPDNVTVTGPYKQEYLGELLREHGITVGFIPSVCPETFSYVTQELLQLGLPLVCFNLGAQAEHILAWKHGLVAEEVSAAAALRALQKLDQHRQ